MIGRPPRAIKRVGVLVRLEPDQWAAINKAAGGMPRHDWIVKTLLGAAQPVKAAKAKAATSVAASSSKLPSLSFGPVARRPGELAKKR